MQQLMAMTHNQTMTSKELVEAINAIRKEEGNDVVIQHKDMLVKIRNLSSVLGQRSVTPDKYLSSIGQEQPMFLLDKRASLLLVSAESARVNLAIIDRWQELEEIQRQALPQTHIQAVEAYLHTLKTVEAQMLTIGSQQKVIDHKKIRTDDSMTHTTMVRVRKLNPGEKYSSLRLIAYCEDNELSIEKVYDAHDQPVNSYPNEAWENVYPDVILPAHL